MVIFGGILTNRPISLAYVRPNYEVVEVEYKLSRYLQIKWQLMPICLSLALDVDF